MLTFELLVRVPLFLSLTLITLQLGTNIVAKLVIQVSVHGARVTEVTCDMHMMYVQLYMCANLI